MMEDQFTLPVGWKRVKGESGKVFYLTRHPQVKIVSKTQLEGLHQGGRFLEMKSEDLNFGTKKRAKKYAAAGRFYKASFGSPKKQKVMENKEMTCDEHFIEDEEINWSKTNEELDQEEVTLGSIAKEVLKVDNKNQVLKVKKCAPYESALHSRKKNLKLENEKIKIEQAVRKLTLNDEKN